MKFSLAPFVVELSNYFADHWKRKEERWLLPAYDTCSILVRENKYNNQAERKRGKYKKKLNYSHETYPNQYFDEAVE